MTAHGVRGITLEAGQRVISMLVAEPGTVLTVTENGYGKRTAIEDFPIKGRGIKGVVSISTSERNGGQIGSGQRKSVFYLEREFGRSAYGPTSQRVIEELIKLLQERDLETLELTYRTLCARIVDPGGDVQRAYELMKGHFATTE